MANNLIAVFAVFAIFGGLLFMMTVLQMILTNYGKEDTKSFYFTFVIILIIIFIMAIASIAGLK